MERVNKRKKLFCLVTAAVLILSVFTPSGILDIKNSSVKTAHAEETGAVRADIMDLRYDLSANTVTDAGDYGFTVERSQGGNVSTADFSRGGLTYRGTAFNKDFINKHMAVNWLSKDTPAFRALFTSGFSMTLAFQASSLERTDAVLMGNAASGGMNLSLLTNAGNRYIRFQIHDGTGYKNADTSYAIQANELYYVTGVYDSEALKIYLYVNGELAAATDVAGFRHSTKFGMAVGGVSDVLASAETQAKIAYSAYRSDNGYFGDVKMYSSALNADQADKQYNDYMKSLQMVTVAPDLIDLDLSDGISNAAEGGVEFTNIGGITAERLRSMHGLRTYEADALKKDAAGKGLLVNIAGEDVTALEGGCAIAAAFSLYSLPASEAVIAGNDKLSLSVNGEGKFIFSLACTFGTVSVISDTAAIAGKSYFAAGRYDAAAGKISIFVNDTMEKETAAAGFSLSGQRTFAVGGSPDTAGTGLITGKEMPDGAIYSACLYSGDIKNVDLLSRYRLFYYSLEEVIAQDVLDVIAMIAGIGAVTPGSGAVLTAIAAAYAQLNQVQKGQVTNYPKYEEANALYRMMDRAPAEFDENNIVLQFGNLSDPHIGFGSGSSQLRNALSILKRHAPNLDALNFAGDQTQDGTRAQAKEFVNVLSEQFDLKETAAVITNGNHDTYWSGCMTTAEFAEAYGEDVYSFDVDRDSITAGNRHTVVNGFHFLSVQIQTFMPNINNLSASTKAWLENTLAAINAENPYAPVFVTSHSPALNTVTGSIESDDTGTWGASAELEPILNKYPQVILFSGHTHYNINDERAIMQKGITHIASGSVSDLDMNHSYFENSSGVAGRRSYSQGMLVEADASGNVRITRLDFVKDEIIKQPWIIPSPKADLSHLYYYTQYRTNEKDVPAFASDADIKVAYSVADKINITYDTASDEDMVYSYLINVYNSGGAKLQSFNSLAPWYMYPDLTKMPPQRTFTIRDFKSPMPFRVEITAVDTWGKQSLPLSVLVEDNPAADQAAADAISARISNLGQITSDSLTAVSVLRADYNALSYHQKLLVSNYPDFAGAEAYLYNTFYVAKDAAKFEVGKADISSIAPTQSKASFDDSEYTGATLKWNLATKNHAIGTKNAYKLDGLHMSFSNMKFESETMSMAFIISSIVNDKYTGGDSLLVYIDFAAGRMYVMNGSNVVMIAEDDLLLYENILATPFDILIRAEGSSYTVVFNTLAGSASGIIPAAGITSAANLTDLTSCYISISPWANNITAQLDWVSIHDGDCYSEELPDDGTGSGEEEGEKPETLTGCKSSSEMIFVLAAVFAVAVCTKKVARK